MNTRHGLLVPAALFCTGICFSPCASVKPVDLSLFAARGGIAELLSKRLPAKSLKKYLSCPLFTLYTVLLCLIFPASSYYV